MNSIVEETGAQEAHKDYLSICTNAVSETLGELTLRHGEALLARSRDRIDANLELMRAFADEHAGRLTWYDPSGGPVGLVTLKGESAEAHSERVRVEGGVLLVPATLFDLDDAHLRIGLGRADFAQALEAWERVI